MPAIGGTRALYSAQRQFKQGLTDLFKEVLPRAVGILTLNSEPDGTIDPRRLPQIKAQIGGMVERLFTPPGVQEGLTDTGQPLAPYGRLLLQHIAFAVTSVVDANSIQMRRALPDDLSRWLTSSNLTESVSEAAGPWAQYKPPYEWVDPNGYVLSDRIWRAGVQTRLKIDALLSDAIRNGTSARDLAAQLERFLLPTRAALRTKRPYGTDASLDAMRLARSEIARAHGQAVKMASIINPFVTGTEWQLSARHPRFDVCDGIATIGMSGERLKDPYPPESAPTPVDSSHPNCLCFTFGAVTATPAEVVADLRRQMAQGQPAPLTPLNGRGMLIKLLGGALAQEALRQIAA